MSRSTQPIDLPAGSPAGARTAGSPSRRRSRPTGRRSSWSGGSPSPTPPPARRRHARPPPARPASRASARTRGPHACGSPTRPSADSVARSPGAPECGDERARLHQPERAGDDPPAHARAAGARHARRRRRRPQPQRRARVVRAPRARATKASGSTSCATRWCTSRRVPRAGPRVRLTDASLVTFGPERVTDTRVVRVSLIRVMRGASM